MYSPAILRHKVVCSLQSVKNRIIEINPEHILTWQFWIFRERLYKYKRLLMKTLNKPDPLAFRISEVYRSPIFKISWVLYNRD